MASSENPPPAPTAPPTGVFDAQPTALVDPHASKIAPDDPRLQIVRAGGRTLRKGPAIAVGTGLLTALGAAGAVALQPPAPSHAVKAEAEPAMSAEAASLPESLQTVATPRPAAVLQSPPVLDAGPPPPPMPMGARGFGGPPDRLAQMRAEEDGKALSAPILFEASQGALRPGGDMPAMIASPPGAPAAPGSSSHASDDDPNRQQRKNDFLDTDGKGDELGESVHHPSSPYQVQAGQIIPAVLLTAVNSDIPGPVIAQVRENVYDTVTGNTLLVPQGSRLLANYDSMVSWGQTRILVCWRRLLFPNGDSIDLHCAPAADLHGAAGLADQVDEHWLRLIAGAGISSLLAASATAAAGNQTSYAPSVPQLWASNGAQSVNQSGQQIVRRDLQVQPTITIREGFSVNVIVHKDLSLPPYQTAEGIAFGAPVP